MAMSASGALMAREVDFWGGIEPDELPLVESVKAVKSRHEQLNACAPASN